MNPTYSGLAGPNCNPASPARGAVVGHQPASPVKPPSSARPWSTPVVTAPDTSRTGWESVSRAFEEHFLRTREAVR